MSPSEPRHTRVQSCSAPQHPATLASDLVLPDPHPSLESQTLGSQFPQRARGGLGEAACCQCPHRPQKPSGMSAHCFPDTRLCWVPRWGPCSSAGHSTNTHASLWITKLIISVPEDRLRGAPLPKCWLPAVSAMRLPLLSPD